METNRTNEVWKNKLEEVNHNYDYVVSPRGMEVKEKLGESYEVPMISFLNLAEREINLGFMFKEAQWIISGSNQLSELTPYMKSYKNYSDDGTFLRGAYGPKVVDQIGWIAETLENDTNSRQAVLNIWRERPGPSKDIPCTTQMQFFIRDNKLHSITSMRSQDIVLGFTYDVFTFSMVAKAVQCLLADRGIETELGNLQVNVGSLHIYERHYDAADKWMDAEDEDLHIKKEVGLINSVKSYNQLVRALGVLAERNN
jgi:thymidylate synthase